MKETNHKHLWDVSLTHGGTTGFASCYNREVFCTDLTWHGIMQGSYTW